MGIGRMFADIRSKLHHIAPGDKNNVIIFIHGLLGDPFGTWKNPKSGKCLHEYIAEDPDLKEYDVYSFEYKSNFHFIRYDFRAVAKILNTEIAGRLSGENIIFVTHSQGGIVATQYLVDLLEEGNVNAIEHILGVIYLAVPFGGSLLGTLMGRIHKQIDSLRMFGEELNLLLSNWYRYTHGTKGNPAMKEAISNVRRLILYGAQDQVVPDGSSNPVYLGAEMFMVDEDHRSICKVDNTSIVFLQMKKFIQQICSIKIVPPMILWIHGWSAQEYEEKADLILDWTDIFDINSEPRTLPNSDGWKQKIIPAIESANKHWNAQNCSYANRIRLYGKLPLSAGILVGNRFSRTKGILLDVSHYGEIWRSDQIAEDFNLSTTRKPGNAVDSKRVALVLSISADISTEVAEFLNSITGFDYKTLINLMPAAGANQTIVSTNGKAISIAVEVKRIADSQKTEGISEIALFINAPLSVAIFIGHFVTAACPIQTYEYSKPGYVVSCRI